MDRTRIGRRTFIAGGTTGIAGLAGCMGGSEAPWEGEGGGDGWTINVGVLAPQSGALERFADEVEDAVGLVERQFESITEPDYDLDVSIRDTESRPEVAAEAGQELVDDGYEIIVGPGTRDSLVALTEEVLEPESALACSPLAAADLTDIDNAGEFYITAARTRTIARGLERPIAMNRVESVSIVHSSSPYGTNIAEWLAGGLSDRGIEVQESVAVEGSDPDTSALEEAVGDDPEGVVFACDPDSGVPLLDAYYDEFDPGYTFLPDRLRLADLPSEIDAGMDEASVVSLKPGWEQVGIRDTGDEDVEDEVEVEDDDRLDWFDEAFEAEYDRHPSIQAAQTFDATLVLVLGAIAAGEDEYGGSEIAERIPGVVNPQTQYEGVRTFSSDTYWEGLTEIEDGVRNNYTGATGNIDFDTNTGLRSGLTLHAVAFAPDTDSGFEETHPIPT